MARADVGAPTQEAEKAVEQALREAGEAVAAAAANVPDEAETAERVRVDRLTVENAMAQLNGSADPGLGERLPQPLSVGHDDILIALKYRSAWTSDDRSGEAYARYKNEIAHLAINGGRLYYFEWACRTGGETAIAHQALALYSKLVTSYPEKLMLRAFLSERSIFGYPSIKDCDYELLEQSRRRYQDGLNVILKPDPREPDISVQN